MDFQSLMAQASAVAKAQDAVLAEKARQRRREEEERQRKEERQQQAREEQQRMLSTLREQKEQQQQRMLQKKQRQRQIERQKTMSTGSGAKSAAGRKSASMSAASLANTSPIRPATARKDAQLSFEELMARAKAMPRSKTAAATTGTSNSSNHVMSRPTLSGKRPPPPAPSISSSSPVTNSSASSGGTAHQHTQRSNIPNIFHKKRTQQPQQGGKHPPSSSPSISSSSMSTISAKERIRQTYRDPPQKLNAKKRDTRSVSEIQRDIRHSKGIYSDDEDARTDPRLIRNKRSGPMASRPLAGGYQRPATTNSPMRRMPFQRPTDIRRPPMKRRMQHEEIDEELASFIVDDEDEEEGYTPGQVGLMLGYDRSKYKDDFSDDDMEANAREVLLEERRSERIGRREDIEEEKKEMERLKRLKRKRNLRT